MAKNAVYDYSVTAASNTDIDALDATGATGLVKSGDNYTRSLMSHLKAKANDDGAVNTVGGTADAITVTLASNPTALVDGMRFSINAPGTNTGAVTIAVSNSGATLLGTKKVRKWSGGAETALSAGDITSGHILNLVYDSARDTAAGAFMIDGSASVAAATTSAAGISEFATAAEFRTGTDTGRALVVSETWNAAAEVTLTDAATIAVDGATFINAVVTLGGNRTLGTWSNPKAGQSGYIRVVQDGAGSRTLAYHADYEFAGGSAPTLSTAIAAQDVLFYQVIASGRVLLSIAKAIA